MKAIPLTQGFEALVDDDDYPILAEHKWTTLTRRYAYRMVDRRSLLMHRVLLNVPPDMEVDHINGDGFDNRRANLRIVSHAQNMRNIHKSRYKGIRFSKQRNRWYAQITVNYKNIYLGTFQSDIAAALAYDVAARQYFGEFALLNFPSRDVA